jgi:hypothetical protein
MKRAAASLWSCSRPTGVLKRPSLTWTSGEHGQRDVGVQDRGAAAGVFTGDLVLGRLVQLAFEADAAATEEKRVVIVDVAVAEPARVDLDEAADAQGGRGIRRGEDEALVAGGGLGALKRTDLSVELGDASLQDVDLLLDGRLGGMNREANASSAASGREVCLILVFMIWVGLVGRSGFLE